MKLILLLLLSFAASNASATYNRFWVGYKKESVSTEAFMNGLNQIFFQETVKVGTGKGLISYQPYITQMKAGLPDELALVTYENEDKYKVIRNTPEGKRYGDLHWDYFAKEKSKSYVPVPFSGVLAIGNAYELSPSFRDWQKNITYLVIYKNEKTDLKLLAKSFESLKNENLISNSVILLTENYIFEYRSYKKDTPLKSLLLNSIELKKFPAYDIEAFPKVNFGEGINFKF